MSDAAARIRAYLDACPNVQSFGRLMPYELPEGAPLDLTRADLEAVLDAVTAAEEPAQPSFPDCPEFVTYGEPCSDCAKRGAA